MNGLYVNSSPIVVGIVGNPCNTRSWAGHTSERRRRQQQQQQQQQPTTTTTKRQCFVCHLAHTCHTILRRIITPFVFSNQCFVGGINRQGKLQIGNSVFMAAIHFRVFVQCFQFRKRIDHVLPRPFKKTSTPTDKQGVTCTEPTQKQPVSMPPRHHPQPNTHSNNTTPTQHQRNTNVPQNNAGGEPVFVHK